MRVDIISKQQLSFGTCFDFGYQQLIFAVSFTETGTLCRLPSSLQAASALGASAKSQARVRTLQIHMPALVPKPRGCKNVTLLQEGGCRCARLSMAGARSEAPTVCCTTAILRVPLRSLSASGCALCNLRAAAAVITRSRQRHQARPGRRQARCQRRQT